MAKLKLFAALREAAGTREAQIEAATVEELVVKACSMYGSAFSAGLDRAKVALNGADLHRDEWRNITIGTDDEVALLPPVSGGTSLHRTENTDVKGKGFAWTGIFAGAMLLASWASSGLLALFVALTAATLSFVLTSRPSGRLPAAGPLSAALGAGALPFWVWSQGEAGLTWGSATVVLLVASVLVLSRPSSGAVNMAGYLIWVPLLVGFGLSYSVLIRKEASGQKLLLCGALILLAYKGSAVVASRTGASVFAQRGAARALPVGLAGIAAAEVAAMLSLLFLEETLRAGPLAILGVFVAIAAMLGEASVEMLSSDGEERPIKIPFLVAVDAWLIALPAFYYGLRLYLT